ncbi:MAG: hypothetical protein ABIJ86_08485 [Spirochaetota bacterium]
MHRLSASTGVMNRLFLLVFLLLWLIPAHVHQAQAAVHYGNYEGDARQLVPAAVIRQHSEIKYLEYANQAYGTLYLGWEDARKRTGDYKGVSFSISAFNAMSKSAQNQCNRPPDQHYKDEVYKGDMNRCAFEFAMMDQATNYFEPGKVRYTFERKFLQTNISRAEYNLFRKPAPKGSFGNYHVLEYTDFQPSSGYFGFIYMVHAGNVFIEMKASTKKDGNLGEEQQAAYDMVNEILGKLPRTGEVETPGELKESAPEEQPVEDVVLVVEAYPSLKQTGSERTALIPASRVLPAKLVAKSAPGSVVTFEIVSGEQAELQAGGSNDIRIGVKADGKGVAEALFFYTGEAIRVPLTYEVRITTPDHKHKETVKVLVGLGLAFDRIIAVKADALDTHAFTLSVKSRFHPQLDLANYLHRAHQSGLWKNQRIGIKLRTTWINPPAGAVPDESFNGTTRIAPARMGANVLTVGDGGPQYYQTDYPYPAVIMKSDGKHVYRVNGGIVLLDANDKEAGFIQEAMEQSDALAIVARDTPEQWLTSLACSLEVQDEVQYLMLETAKMLPGGDVVDALTTATGLMCKFGRDEYESLIYDLGTLMGGKYLDHLNEPDVLKKLTPKQQEAAKLAKEAYDRLDEHKQNEERDKWLGEAGERFRNSKTGKPTEESRLPVGQKAEKDAAGKVPDEQNSAPGPSGQDGVLKKTGDELEKGVEDIQKSVEEMGSTVKDIFKGILKK